MEEKMIDIKKQITSINDSIRDLQREIGKRDIDDIRAELIERQIELENARNTLIQVDKMKEILRAIVL
jgi:hypothetical protein